MERDVLSGSPIYVSVSVQYRRSSDWPLVTVGGIFFTLGEVW